MKAQEFLVIRMMKKVNSMAVNKKGIIYTMLVPTFTFMILAYVTYSFLTQTPLTLQELGSIQGDILTSIGTTEKNLYYLDLAAHQSATETLYHLGRTGGIPSNANQKCFRPPSEYNIYSEQCIPNNMEKTFLTLVEKEFEKKLKEKNIASAEYHYRLEKDETYRLVITAVQEQKFAITNNPLQEPEKKGITPKFHIPEHLNELIGTAARKYNVNPDLLRAIIKAESSGNQYPPASGKNAKGLMQITPIVIADLDHGASHAFCNGKGLDQELLHNPDLYDPYTNIELGTCYFAYLIDHYQGNTELAIAAYNAGPTRVDKDQKIPNIEETQTYVKRVKRYYAEKSPITGAAVVHPINPLEVGANVGSIIVSPSINISIEQNFDDYTKIHTKIKEQRACLIKKEIDTCLTNDLGFTWSMSKDSAGFVLVHTETKTKDYLRPEREGVTISFYVDPQWQKTE